MGARTESVIDLLKRFFDRGHGRFLGMLSDYIDGELEPGPRAALEGHLAGCPSCTEELESLRSTVLMLQRMPEVEAPRSFRLAPASAPTPAPEPERPVFLWAMRVSTALAVVAFTIMVAGNVSGLWDVAGVSEDEGRGKAASEAEMSSDSPDFSPTAMPDAMMEEPDAAMQAQPDFPPRSTPMLMPEPTGIAEFEPEAMPEPTPTPEVMMEESATEPTSAMSDEETAEFLEEDDSAARTSAPEPIATPVPAPTATSVQTPLPSPTPRPTSTASTTPTPAPTPTATPSHEPTRFAWTGTNGVVEDEEGGGVVLGLTIGLGALAGALALGTIYLTLKRRRGVGSS